jgi:hypothetical protein
VIDKRALPARCVRLLRGVSWQGSLFAPFPSGRELGIGLPLEHTLPPSPCPSPGGKGMSTQVAAQYADGYPCRGVRFLVLWRPGNGRMRPRVHG